MLGFALVIKSIILKWIFRLIKNANWNINIYKSIKYFWFSLSIRIHSFFLLRPFKLSVLLLIESSFFLELLSEYADSLFLSLWRMQFVTKDLTLRFDLQSNFLLIFELFRLLLISLLWCNRLNDKLLVLLEVVLSSGLLSFGKSSLLLSKVNIS